MLRMSLAPCAPFTVTNDLMVSAFFEATAQPPNHVKPSFFGMFEAEPSKV